LKILEDSVDVQQARLVPRGANWPRGFVLESNLHSRRTLMATEDNRPSDPEEETRAALHRLLRLIAREVVRRLKVGQENTAAEVEETARPGDAPPSRPP
jgi:hypothetical protein